MTLYFNQALRTITNYFIREYAKMEKDLGIPQIDPTSFELKRREKCEKFVFDSTPELYLAEFSIDMVKEGLFQLPFNECYFQWEGDDGIYCMFAISNASELEIIGDKVLIFPTRYNKEHGRWEYTLPISLIVSNLKTLIISRGTLDITGTCGKDAYATENEKFYEKYIRELFACTTILATRGVTRTVVSVGSAQTNRKRARKGFPPLPTYTVVGTQNLRSTRGEGGTHASPRPHFRRGHVRTLAEGKQTLVRPCIVMAEPGAMPNYMVKA